MVNKVHDFFNNLNIVQTVHLPHDDLLGKNKSLVRFSHDETRVRDLKLIFTRTNKQCKHDQSSVAIRKLL